MSIKTLKCTTCGANIELDDSREFGFCQFCGTKLMLVDKVEIKHTGHISVEGIQSVKERIDNYNILFKNSFLERNYFEAERYLEKILQLDSQNSLAWLNRCKILVVKTNKQVEKDIKQFTLYSANCYKYSNDENKERLSKQLSELLNDFIEVLLCIVEDNNLAIVPFDYQTLFSVVPSANYNPLLYIDHYHFLLEECINSFKENVNQLYDSGTFENLWKEFYYRICSEITDCIINSLDHNRAFDAYNDMLNINSKFIDPVTYGQLNNSLWGYRNSLKIIFEQLPFENILKEAGKNIIFVDNWLLKIKCSSGFGRAKNQLTSQQKSEIKNEIKMVKTKIRNM